MPAIKGGEGEKKGETLCAIRMNHVCLYSTKVQKHTELHKFENLISSFVIFGLLFKVKIFCVLSILFQVACL